MQHEEHDAVRYLDFLLTLQEEIWLWWLRTDETVAAASQTDYSTTREFVEAITVKYARGKRPIIDMQWETVRETCHWRLQRQNGTTHWRIVDPFDYERARDEKWKMTEVFRYIQLQCAEWLHQRGQKPQE